MFSGGALEHLSIFALGIMPYVSASIILQLLTVVVPKLEELQKEGRAGAAEDQPVHALRQRHPVVVQAFGIARWLGVEQPVRTRSSATSSPIQAGASG